MTTVEPAPEPAARPVPTRDEILAVWTPGARASHLATHFEITSAKMYRLMVRYNIPRARNGNPGLPRQPGHTPKPAPPKPPPTPRPTRPKPGGETAAGKQLSEAMNRVAAQRERTAAARLAALLERAEMGRPAPTPCGTALGDDWPKWALCRGLDPELFMPTRLREAKRIPTAVCGMCPVRDVCPHSWVKPAAAKPAA